jgi:glutamyl-tRNA reductase
VERFGIIHYCKTSNISLELRNLELNKLSALGSSFVLFETCLRKIYFYDTTRFDSTVGDLLCELQASQSNKNDNFDIFENQKAYQFILEVISGLKSNIKGETEIFGQFKLFYEQFKLKNLESSSFLDQVFSQLIQDCKFLREKHIKNWGSQSYGSLTRKLLDKQNPLLVIGKGQLAREMAPWLTQIPSKYLVVRDLQKKIDPEFQDFSQVLINDMSAISYSGRINLVIAAPLTHKELESFMKSLKDRGLAIHKVVDWRGGVELPINDESEIKKENYFHLSDIKNTLAESEETLNEKIKIVQIEISKMIEKFGKKVQLYPWGWDDICA